MAQFYVYILASHSKTIYIGMTNDLSRRLAEHKSGDIGGFTQQYHLNRLVYFETSADVNVAIRREKQLKRWPRWRKIRLIELGNPDWRDLSVRWFDSGPAKQPIISVQ
jgi:putative endonuclease